MNKLKSFFVLHVMLMIYSMGGICSKFASKYSFLSLGFCFFYGLLIVILGFYALIWQQIIKIIPLTTAYSHRAVTVIWGAIWGYLVFHESISLIKLVGIALVVLGIIVYALADTHIEGL